MKPQQQTTLVLAVAVLISSLATSCSSGNAGALASASSGENLTVSEGSPLISNKVIDTLIVYGGSPIIQNCLIHNRIIVQAGSPTFIGNIIEDGIHADAKEGPVTITNNEIYARSGFSAIYLQGIHADINGNRINGNHATGIQLWLDVTSATILDNKIFNCSTGIVASDGHIEVAGNRIFNNTVGIHYWRYVNIHGNTIAYNSIGIQGTHSAVNENNIQNNTVLNLENMWLADMDATNNWWGTTNKTLLQKMLFHNDNYTGSIDYEPYLNESSQNAPVLTEEDIKILNQPPTQTPTHSPTEVAGGFLVFEGLQIAVVAVTAAAVGIAVVVFLLRQKTKPHG